MWDTNKVTQDYLVIAAKVASTNYFAFHVTLSAFVVLTYFKLGNDWIIFIIGCILYSLTWMSHVYFYTCFCYIYFNILYLNCVCIQIYNRNWCIVYSVQLIMYWPCDSYRLPLFPSMFRLSCVLVVTSCWNVWKLYLSSNIFVSRLRLASFDSRGKLVCSRSTGYQLLTLEKDQVSEYSLVTISKSKL